MYVQHSDAHTFATYSGTETRLLSISHYYDIMRDFRCTANFYNLSKYNSASLTQNADILKDLIQSIDVSVPHSISNSPSLHISAMEHLDHH